MPRVLLAAAAVALTARDVRTSDKIRLLRLGDLLPHRSGGQTHEVAEGLRTVVRRSHVLRKIWIALGSRSLGCILRSTA